MKKKISYSFLFLYFFLMPNYIFADLSQVIFNTYGYQFYSHAPYLEDDNNWKRYFCENLFDGKIETSWAIEHGGLGVNIYISIPKNATTINLVNGYATNEDLFFKNNRVKTIRVELCVAYSFPHRVSEQGWVFDVDSLAYEKTFELVDTIEPQKLDLGADYWQKANKLIKKSNANFKKQLSKMDEEEKTAYAKGLVSLNLLRIEIIDIYAGTKWDDTCLSELGFEQETRSVPGAEGLVGFWQVMRGADYEEVEFADDGYLFAYAGTRPWDNAYWSLENKTLKIEWYSGEEDFYTFFYKEEDTFTLVSTDGHVLVLEKIE